MFSSSICNQLKNEKKKIDQILSFDLSYTGTQARGVIPAHGIAYLLCVPSMGGTDTMR